MKKIIIKLLILLSIIGTAGVLHIQNSYAENTNVVIVTEKVPGGNCTLIDGKKLYRCEIKSGFGSIMQVMGKLLKYFTFIAGLLGVLTLVIGGIMYSMGGADEGMKTQSKEFITKSLLGLVVLLLSGIILYTIAPWVYK